MLAADYVYGTYGTVFQDLTKLLASVDKCIAANTPDKVCANCVPAYGMASLFYTKLAVEKGNDHICYDMKDAVSSKWPLAYD